MPLPLKNKKHAAVEFIIKRMKGSDDYERMKDHNEQGPEVMIKREGPEADYKVGMEAAVDQIMSAFQEKDKMALKKSLKDFICLVMEEKEKPEESDY